MAKYFRGMKNILRKEIGRSCKVMVLLLSSFLALETGSLLRSADRTETTKTEADSRVNPSRQSVELAPRKGLPNFFSKAKGDGKIKVAYFGGSITEANGWRQQSLAWFKEHYPKAEFVEINAAIGGTGSDLGVYRLKRDVLDQKPDLVFVEFAVNDGGASPAQIYRCMEGIVRQIWKADPATDICFVYTLHEGMVKEMASGKLPRSASAMEWIADHYGIPSIEMACEPVKLIQSGEWIFTSPKSDVPADTEKGLPARKAFAPDGCHPFADTGHRLYTQSIVRSFTSMEQTGEAGPHGLPAAFTPDNHENAKLIPLSSDLLKEGWKSVNLKSDPIGRNFAKRLPVLWLADQAGTTLSFRFHGRAAFVYDLLGPDGGELEITTDDGKPASARRFDAYCTYHRLGLTCLVSDLEPKDHHVIVRLTNKTFDKAAILKQNGNKIEDPARYEPLRWYAGALLIDGDILPDASGIVPQSK